MIEAAARVAAWSELACQSWLTADFEDLLASVDRLRLVVVRALADHEARL